MFNIHSIATTVIKKINKIAVHPSAWLILLLLIIVSHLLIKLIALPYMEVKGDESYSIFHAQQTFGELMLTFQEEANPPLFFILLQGWISIFGISLFAVKSFSVLISIGTAIFIFLLGKQTGSFMMTLFASSCFLFSNLHFDYSHEIRAFQLVLFLTVGSIYFFLNYIRAPYEGSLLKQLNVHWLKLLLIFIFTLSLTYSHYNAVFVPFIQLLVSCVLARKEFSKMVVLWCIWLLAAVAFLPQLSVFRNIIPNEHFWLELASVKDLNYIHLKLVGNDALFYVLLVPFYLSPLIALFMKRRGWLKRQFSWTVFFVFWLLFPLPILLNFWVAHYIPSFQIRYLLFSSLGLYLSLGYIFGMFQRFKVVANGFLMLTAIHFIYSFSPQNRESEGWKETAEMVRNFKKQNVLVLVNASYKTKDLMYYYDPVVFSDYKNFENRCKDSTIFPVINGLDLLQIKDLNQYKKVLVVLNHHANQDPKGTLLSELDKRFNLCYEIGDGIGAKIRVYTAKNEQCTNFKVLHKKPLSHEKTGRWEYRWLYEAMSSTRVDAYIFKPIAHTEIKVDAENAFSPLRKTFAKNVSLVDVSIHFHSTELPNSVLIVSVEKGSTTFKRAEYPLANYYQNGSGQLSIKSSVMGSYPKGALVKSYVWNPGGTTVFLDSLNIAFWRK